MPIRSAVAGLLGALALSGLAMAEPLAAAPTTFAPAPAMPAGPAPAATPGDKAKPADEPKICYDERDTGSHMSHRVCMTRKEYRARHLEG